MVPFVLTTVDGLGRLFFPLCAIVRLVAGPLTVGYALVLTAVNAQRGTLPWSSIAWLAALCLVVRYARTALYLVERPGMNRHERFWTWLLLTPAEAAYQLLFLIPIRYLALFKLRDHGRRTRNAAHRADIAHPPSGDAGSIYYSGYLADSGRP
jgi:hypothetical protein